MAKARAVADVVSLQRRLTELEGRASAGDLWDDPSHAAAVRHVHICCVKRITAISFGMATAGHDCTCPMCNAMCIPLSIAPCAGCAALQCHVQFDGPFTRQTAPRMASR